MRPSTVSAVSHYLRLTRLHHHLFHQCLLPLRQGLEIKLALYQSVAVGVVAVNGARVLLGRGRTVTPLICERLDAGRRARAGTSR